MRTVRLAGLVIFGLFLLAAGAAHAGDQSICTKLSLNGLNNSTIIAGYKVTDFTAVSHECSPGSSNGCSVCADAKYYPKNVGNYLCLPPDLLTSISPQCQSLLQSGANNECSKNGNTSSPTCGGGRSIIAPVCNWRTGDNDREAAWNWSLSVSGSTVIIDCSTTNYQGYTQ